MIYTYMYFIDFVIHCLCQVEQFQYRLSSIFIIYVWLAAENVIISMRQRLDF